MWIIHNETHQNLFITINSNKLNNQDQIYADLYIPKSLLSHEQSFKRMFQFVHHNEMFQLKTEINNSTNEITVRYPNKNEYHIKINYFWAGDGIRTRDLVLGKDAYYHCTTPANLQL